MSIQTKNKIEDNKEFFSILYQNNHRNEY